MDHHSNDWHRRRSIRLRGYDYAQAGAYFVTVCTQNRVCLFGEVVDGAMRLNEAGRMVQMVWDELPVFYPGAQTDAWILMPNHAHGIIVLPGRPVGAGPRACPDIAGQPQGVVQPQGVGQPQGVAPTLSLPDLVHRFKTMTTKRYADGVKTVGWQPFNGRLWQRNYYEHIIRDEASLVRIREYIINNPQQWALDQENPDKATPRG